jgi:hypothetical protein
MGVGDSVQEGKDWRSEREKCGGPGEFWVTEGVKRGREVTGWSGWEEGSIDEETGASVGWDVIGNAPFV